MVTKYVLITGVTGFVGRMLCSELALRNYSVRGAVRDFSHSVELHCELEKVGDIGSVTDWSVALEGVDIVVHLAARMHVMREKNTDIQTEFRKVNVGGTLNLARQASRAGVRRFIYLSSIKVNGEQTLPEQPFTEKDATAPVDSYALSKYEAEEGLQKLALQSDMEVVIIRPPLVYGPDVKGNFLAMMHWLHKGVPLPLGAINNRRSLIALDNLVDLIVTCLHHTAAANQVFLAGDGKDLSTTDLLQRLGKALNRPARLIPVPLWLLQKGAVMVGKRGIALRLCGTLQVDIAKASSLLGWTPPVSVEEALQKTAQAYLQGVD